MKIDLDLKLEPESANVDDDDKGVRREITKLKEELEEDKKKLIQKEVELDNERANHESEMDDLKKKLEKVQSELKKVQDAEKLALQRVKELVCIFCRVTKGLTGMGFRKLLCLPGLN